MTSTNDGKDVKSNLTSDPKGKTYFIQLYKSLEAALSSCADLPSRCEALVNAWGRVHCLCSHSAPSTHQHLLTWLQRHTAAALLQTGWQDPSNVELHTKLRDAIDVFISEAAAAAARRGLRHDWESNLVGRAEWFKRVLPDPWGHPVLRKLLDQRGEQPTDVEVLEWLKEERGVTMTTRLRQLATAKCDDLALALTTAVMDRVRTPPDDTKHAGTSGKLDGNTFSMMLQEEADFTPDVWDQLVDIEFVLLHKLERTAKCIELAKLTPLRSGYQIVERLRTRLNASPKEKKLWKNAKEVAVLVAQVIITRCMVMPSPGACREALFRCTSALTLLLPPARLASAAVALAAPAVCARHLHTLAFAVHTQYKDTMKAFVCELYVRAITAGMNELERLKLKTEKESEATARAMEKTLSSWFLQVGSLLKSSRRVQCECALTAFSLHPSSAMLENLSSAPPLPTLTLNEELEVKDEPQSEFGSWSKDSRTQSNLVKTSETLNLKQSQQHQANVLSTAILTEGEGLGLSHELCQDLAVLLSGPRVKTLSWDMDREQLLSNCRAYMEATGGGTRTVTTELKYLNLDLAKYQHLPEEDDEDQLYYGIERGYEHLVELPEPEEIWADALLTDYDESSDTSKYADDDYKEEKKARRKHKKLAYLSEESDPLSLSSPKETVKKERKNRAKHIDHTDERTHCSQDRSQSQESSHSHDHSQSQESSYSHDHSQSKESSHSQDRSQSQESSHSQDHSPSQGSSHSQNHSQSVERRSEHSTDIKKKRKYKYKNKSREKSQELKEKPKKEKKERKEKRERKRPQLLPDSIPLTGNSLSQLIGMKVSGTSEVGFIDRHKQDKMSKKKHSATDSDYESQGKSSIASLTSIDGPPESDVLFDGLFSMDELKTVSPVKPQIDNSNLYNNELSFRNGSITMSNAPVYTHSTQTPPQSCTNIDKDNNVKKNDTEPNLCYSSAVCDEVRQRISSLLQFRKQKQLNSPVSSPRSPDVHEPVSSNNVTTTKKNGPKILNVTSDKDVISKALASTPIDFVKKNYPQLNMSTVKKEALLVIKQNKTTGDNNLSVVKSTAIPPDAVLKPGNIIKNQNTTLPAQSPDLGKPCIQKIIGMKEFLTELKTQSSTKLQKSNMTKADNLQNIFIKFAEASNLKITKADPANTTPNLINSKCAKPLVYQKKVENAPNTFSRLSYMHKNKQIDTKVKQNVEKPLQKTITQQEAISDELERHIKDFQMKKLLHTNHGQQTSGECSASSQKTISSSNLSLSNPTIAEILSPVNKETVNQELKVQAPTVQSYKSQIDEKELLSLLHQKNILNARNTYSEQVAINKIAQNLQNLEGYQPTNVNINNINTIILASSYQNQMINKMVQDKPIIVNQKPVVIYKSVVPSAASKLVQQIVTSAACVPKTNTSHQHIKKKKDENEIKQDLKNVMDALLAHKTPVRGHNALDLALLPDQNETMSILRQQRINKPNVLKCNTKLISNNSYKQQELVTKTTPVIPCLPGLTIATKLEQSSVNKKTEMTPCNVLKNVASSLIIKKVPKKQTKSKNVMVQNECKKNVNQPNNVLGNQKVTDEYGLLDELMDQDLLQEIGELSDEEFNPDVFLNPTDQGIKSMSSESHQISVKPFNTNVSQNQIIAESKKITTSEKCIGTSVQNKVILKNEPNIFMHTKEKPAPKINIGSKVGTLQIKQNISLSKMIDTNNTQLNDITPLCKNMVTNNRKGTNVVLSPDPLAQNMSKFVLRPNILTYPSVQAPETTNLCKIINNNFATYQNIQYTPAIIKQIVAEKPSVNLSKVMNEKHHQSTYSSESQKHDSELINRQNTNCVLKTNETDTKIHKSLQNTNESDKPIATIPHVTINQELKINNERKVVSEIQDQLIPSQQSDVIKDDNISGQNYKIPATQDISTEMNKTRFANINPKINQTPSYKPITPMVQTLQSQKIKAIKNSVAKRDLLSDDNNTKFGSCKTTDSGNKPVINNSKSTQSKAGVENNLNTTSKVEKLFDTDTVLTEPSSERLIHNTIQDTLIKPDRENKDFPKQSKIVKKSKTINSTSKRICKAKTKVRLKSMRKISQTKEKSMPNAQDNVLEQDIKKLKDPVITPTRTSKRILQRKVNLEESEIPKDTPPEISCTDLKLFDVEAALVGSKILKSNETTLKSKEINFNVPPSYVKEKLTSTCDKKEKATYKEEEILTDITCHQDEKMKVTVVETSRSQISSQHDEVIKKKEEDKVTSTEALGAEIANNCDKILTDILCRQDDVTTNANQQLTETLKSQISSHAEEIKKKDNKVTSIEAKKTKHSDETTKEISTRDSKVVTGENDRTAVSKDLVEKSLNNIIAKDDEYKSSFTNKTSVHEPQVNSKFVLSHSNIINNITEDETVNIVDAEKNNISSSVKKGVHDNSDSTQDKKKDESDADAINGLMQKIKFELIKTVPPIDGRQAYRIIRLIMPDGMSFQVTIYGTVKIDFQSFINNPQIKQIVTNNTSASKRYKLNIKHASVSGRLLKVEKAEEIPLERNENVETVDLISDEELEIDKLQYITTEFGRYKIVNSNVLIEHQKKVNQKCSVKLIKRPDSYFEELTSTKTLDSETLGYTVSDTEIDNLTLLCHEKFPKTFEDLPITTNIGNPQTSSSLNTALNITEVIELDDSSNDEISNLIPHPSSINIVLPKTKSETEPEDKIKELKNLLLNDLGVTVDELKPIICDTANTVTQKICQQCCVTLERCDDIVSKYKIENNEIENICETSINKPDHLMNNEIARNLNDSIEVSDDELNFGTISPIIVPRDGSPSLLCLPWSRQISDKYEEDILDLALLDMDTSLESDGRTSPVIEVFEIIANLKSSTETRKIDICCINCHSEWFSTKKILREKSPLLLSFQVPSLVKTVLEFLENNNVLDKIKSWGRSEFSIKQSRQLKRKYFASEVSTFKKVPRLQTEPSFYDIVSPKEENDFNRFLIKSEVEDMNSDHQEENFETYGTESQINPNRIDVSINLEDFSVPLEEQDRQSESYSSLALTEIKHVEHGLSTTGKREDNLSAYNIDIQNQTDITQDVSIHAQEEKEKKFESCMDDTNLTYLTHTDIDAKAINQVEHIMNHLEEQRDKTVSGLIHTHLDSILTECDYSEKIKDASIHVNENYYEVKEELNTPCNVPTLEHELQDNAMVNKSKSDSIGDLKITEEPDDKSKVVEISNDDAATDLKNSETSYNNQSDNLTETLVHESLLDKDNIQNKAPYVPIENEEIENINFDNKANLTKTFITTEIRSTSPNECNTIKNNQDIKSAAEVDSTSTFAFNDVKGLDKFSDVNETNEPTKIGNLTNNTELTDVKLDGLNCCGQFVSKKEQLNETIPRDISDNQEENIKFSKIQNETDQPVRRFMGTEYKHPVIGTCYVLCPVKEKNSETDSSQPSVCKSLNSSKELVEIVKIISEDESAGIGSISFDDSSISENETNDTSADLESTVTPNDTNDQKFEMDKEPMNVNDDSIMQLVEEKNSETDSSQPSVCKSLNSSKELVEIVKIISEDESAGIGSISFDGSSISENETNDTFADLESTVTPNDTNDQKFEEDKEPMNVNDDNIMQREADLQIIVPKRTYETNILKRKHAKKDMKHNLAKRYRKGKNIDCPKFNSQYISESSYCKEFKRIIEYINTVKLSFACPYQKDYVDVEQCLENWPIAGSVPKQIEDTEIKNENTLFQEVRNIPRDPLQQTLEEEIICDSSDNQYPTLEESITNFNMGFGERSDRVIQNLKEGGVISKFSAATLSDVKQTQPLLQSEEYKVYKSHSKIINNSQREQLRRYVTYIQLKDKVRSYFKKMRSELLSNTKENKSEHNAYDVRKILQNVPGLYGTEFIEPPPLVPFVNVVQVGQLPVSAAAQNPVTCDPRVTQVSDASPSQCSIENSPGSDNNQPIKAEYTELTTADLSLPLVQDLTEQSMIPQEKTLINDEQSVIPREEEFKEEANQNINSSILVENNQETIDYEYDANANEAINISSQLTPDLFTTEPSDSDYMVHKQEKGPPEKTDQLAHAMNAAGIRPDSPDSDTRAHQLFNIISQNVLRKVPTTTVTTSANNYSKINAMALQQALASILPPPLNHTSGGEGQQQTQQVLHIVQGKNASGNQITLVDNSQPSVLGNNATQVLHIVQNKGNAATNGNPNTQGNQFSGISLVDAGLQQGGNQLLHIVNTGNQKGANAGQILKRVNLLTNLTNVQGGNEQKMVQFVCKSADGKAIHLNAPHQRSMVLRLQPIETPNLQQTVNKPIEPPELSPAQGANNPTTDKDSANQQGIKSRSVYEENYAKFIQNSSGKSTVFEKSTSLPKFNQAFGKPVFQEGTQKPTEMDNSHIPPVNTTDNAEPTETPINLDHISQISSPPLLLRKTAVSTSQTQSNLVQQLKQTIAPMNIQTMHGGVIYTRQIPVNIGGGQTINLITVPSTELIDENGQKQQTINQNDIEPSIIKIVPQSQTTEGNSDDNTHMSNETSQSSQPQPVLTQMRIKLPMLSKTQQLSGTRVVRPSFFQIQRNVIGGANQPVYQQLVLTAAPPLGQQTIRLPQARQIKIPTETTASPESQLSSSTLEQLREFDMVLEQVKERSTVQPGTTNTYSKLHTPSTDTTDSSVSVTTSSTVPEPTPQQVLYSIGNTITTSTLNVAYVNRKASVTTPTTSTYVRSPDSSGIVDSPSSSTQVPSSVVTEPQPSTETPSQPKPSKSSKNRPPKPSSSSSAGPSSSSSSSSSSHPPNAMKINHIPPKTSTQKPLEDEQTTQRILYILAEYKEQVENSPDKDKPAPRRRSNLPTTGSGSSKRKKSSSGRRHGCTRDHSPITGDDSGRTMGSEDSSCGTSQGDCTESCSIDTHSPQDSPRKIGRKLSFEPEQPAVAQPRPQPPRNVIVADGQTITVARSATGKPTTAVLMPANYILPVSMVKGGQQIAIVTNRGPKLLTVGGATGEGAAANALLLQRLIGPAGLKPVLARPGVRHVRLPTAALHNLQAFNLTAAVPPQPPDSTASPAPAPTPDLVETRAASSPWNETGSDVKPERGSSPETTEPWNLQTNVQTEYTYEEPVTSRNDSVDRTVLVVHKKDGSSHSLHRVTHISSAALRHKYAILEHELRLQKSLSEECEDLGVDSPSASDLFPEAELLFAASPAAQEHSSHVHEHTPQSTLTHTSIPQPDIDDQIATDQLLPTNTNNEELTDVNLGLGDVGIVTVSEDGMQATIQLDQEEFARSHPNTTFHSDPTEDGEEVQPFSLSSNLKGRHITSIYHSNGAPATVLMATPQTVISQAQAAPEASGANNVKYNIHSEIDSMIHHLPASHTNSDINLSSVLVKDDGLTRFDNILTDRELHLSNTASAIVHNATQVIRRVCYDDDKRDRFLMDEPDAIIAGNDAKMAVAEDSCSRDATLESMEDEASSPERHAELFWESNSASERSESRRPLEFSSDSEKCCKSPSLDETNSTDSSGVGTHLRLDSVIKEARSRDRSGSLDCSSADDTIHPPIRTYPPKRSFQSDADLERSLTGKTRAGERSPDSPEIRRRASARDVVKRGCHCCNGSPVPPRPKKPRQRKPTLDFTHSN